MNTSSNNKDELILQKIEEPHFSYGSSEDEQLLRALKRSHQQRFEVMTKLMRMNLMLRKAKITHYTPPSSH